MAKQITVKDMGSTLFIDAGNRRMKIADYNRERWELVASLGYDHPEIGRELRPLCQDHENIVIASVKKSWQPEDFKKLLNRDVIGITSGDIPSSHIAYRSVNTLGIDRFLSCLGAWSESRSAVIVSDAGTACTIDVMDDKGVYLGGVIMPGLRLMIDALVSGTDGLFHVEAGIPSEWPPQTTETALQAGLAGSFIAAWESHVRKHLNLFPEAAHWVTGGDAEIIQRYSPFEMQADDHLVFQGMRTWLLNKE